MLSVDTFPPELEQWIASRFEMLNGRRVHIIRNKDLPADARDINPLCLQPWLWDVVPKDTKRILNVDSDMVPLRSLPDLPDAEFVAALDTPQNCHNMSEIYPAIGADGRFFNAGFFVASRSMQPVFEQMKLFVSNKRAADAKHGDFLQTIFNLLVRSATSIEWMSHDLNSVMLMSTPKTIETAIAIHFCALPRNTSWVLMNALRAAIGLSKL
jgi:lipopolysaccharide biosynthesis glycosyltransferase